MAKATLVRAWRCSDCSYVGTKDPKVDSHYRIPRQGRKLPLGLIYARTDGILDKGMSTGKLYTVVVGHYRDMDHLLHNDEIQFLADGSIRKTDMVLIDLRAELTKVKATLLTRQGFSAFKREWQDSLAEHSIEKFVRIPPKQKHAFFSVPGF